MSASSVFHRPRRGKSDWAGIHFTDAFKRRLDLVDRMTAEKMFYDVTRKLQIRVARETGQKKGPSYKPLVKPQIAPCYTSYPSTLSAYAALGLTAFLEFQTLIRGLRILEYSDQSLDAFELKVDATHYSQVAEIVTTIVETRLFLQALACIPSMTVVEMYRLFAASQQSLQFLTVREIVQSVVLFGDIFPPPEDIDLHPLTRSLLREVSKVSQPFFDQMSNLNGVGLFEFGIKWIREICFALAKYMPQESAAENSSFVLQKRNWLDRITKSGDNNPADNLAPLNESEAPAWFDPLPLDRKMLNSRSAKRDRKPKLPLENDAPSSGKAQAINEFLTAIRSACGQTDKFDDMRFDIMENILAQTPFEAGPVDGTPLDGHDVAVSFGDQKTATGKIFDRSLSHSFDERAYESLLEDSRPVTEALKKVLYPNITESLNKKRRRTSGGLDPARLSLSSFATTIYQQWGKIEEPNPRGNPVVLIACDASGSLNYREMHMAKILTAAWLNSTVRSDVRVLAGIYHSDRIHNIENAPLVQWIYHPKKSSGMKRTAAIKALAGLPSHGTGVQSDVLSIAFMLEEARRLARGKMIYLVLVTDCQWNRSFNSSVEGEIEMLHFFRKLYQQSEKLHITLVALGFCSKEIEQMLDRVIVLNWDRQGSAEIAEQIGTYVASVVRERKTRKRKQ